MRFVKTMAKPKSGIDWVIFNEFFICSYRICQNRFIPLGSACTADVILSAAELNVDDFKLS